MPNTITITKGTINIRQAVADDSDRLRELRIEALGRGASAVLQKPFELAELTSMLECQGE